MQAAFVVPCLGDETREEASGPHKPSPGAVVVVRLCEVLRRNVHYVLGDLPVLAEVLSLGSETCSPRALVPECICEGIHINSLHAHSVPPAPAEVLGLASETCSQTRILAQVDAGLARNLSCIAV
jgi:hypothetical protein